ncbi:MAG: TonB-dependent receptor [Burkholderiales bacterium]|nr:TonB-dependent receptor [Burkholderiales bacterium]
MRKTPFTPTRLCVLIQALVLLPAAAQTTATPGDSAAKTLDTVVVSGIRASVRKALDTKEASNSMVEVIASEDIGKLPDTTIAESLARLPGLSAGIDRGNASQIVARGLGPRFVGATLNGREFASSEPDRAVRFEMFPAESVSGATVYKTQSAEIVEGGIATTIDLQTVQPLAWRERTLSLKADALYYQLGSSIQGAKTYAPRLGGIYVDQFASRTLGVALAFSYYDQPSLEDRVDNWGFNDTHSADVTGDGKVDKTPWGFQNGVKKGTDKRSSLLGKVEYKPDADTLITGDVYAARSNVLEPTLVHVQGNLGNWDGWQSGDYSKVTTDGGNVTGATVNNVQMDNLNARWKQNMRNFAAGVNGKFKLDAWQLEADVARSTAARDTMWSAVQMSMLQPGAVTWSFPRDAWMTYSFSRDTGNPAAFSTNVTEQWGPTYVGKLDDTLNSQQFNASRAVDWGVVSKLKFGLRATQREKSYAQTSWNYSGAATVPTSAFQRVTVDGRPDFIEFSDGFGGAVGKYFGANALSADGRSPTASDLVQNSWRAKERNSAAFAQADLGGNAFGDLSWRGNAGLRVVHSSQTGYGMEQVNGGAPTPVSAGTGYTRFLPSLNLILNLDAEDVNQLRFGLSRAMARAPLDVMNAAHTVNVDPNGVNPTTVSGGNPQLKPMMANQVDLTFQRYFDKGSLVSVGLFYKQVRDYIGIASVAGTFDGKPAYFTQQVNRDGGNVRGVEFIYQQAFTHLPEPFNGLGLMANYAYTDSNIQENGDRSGGTFTPIATNGLMKGNGGFTLWYAAHGFEARLAANHHSAYNRAPTWDSTAFQLNGAETWVSLNLSQQLTPQLQARFGVENASNQRVTYTDPLNPWHQTNFQFGRRFNVGLTYKL